MKRAYLIELVNPEFCAELQAAQRDAWRADRTDQLYTDPREIAEHLQGGDEADYELLVDLIAGVLMPGDPGMTSLDRTITRQEACESALEKAIQKILDAEEREGKWEGYGE